eukprot:TRINITY_DN13321_c0_g1_i1.p1 TRINITY_DN13321_c0_g1~~TRINITY_DN13321_c0_g1_i1.p1  ORF type:complete len:164 (+),score=43.66 TRINITY_DN13321_c0_g1_i1:49-540(+)
MEISASDEDFPQELVDVVKKLNISLDNLDEGFADLLSHNRTEMYESMDPLTRAKVDIVSLYSINSLFWMLLKTLGHNPQASDMKAELGRVQGAIKRCKEIQDREKRGKVDQQAAKRMITSGLWNPGEEKIRSENEMSGEERKRIQEINAAATPPKKKIKQFDV